MTSSMLRRQLKNLVQNYSEAEVKVREATSNDPWGPSSSQMADISDLTYNVVACNEIMTMLWKRLKDDKNWRHIHKSLTLLEYLLKTGDDRVLLKMKDNIYIVKALTEYRFVEKDGKDQGANVREKAKVVLVLMEDDEKLKQERDFAVKTREKTSKSSAASSTDAIKDPNYMPRYVAGATGLPSLDNIPSVADLTASFAARKEERLRQEAEKKDAERRAKMSEDELQWEDAGKGICVATKAWGEEQAKEEEVKPDPWGAPKEPKEATDPWGTPTRPDTTDTAASSDPWGAPTKADEDQFASPTSDEDQFEAPKNGDDHFIASKDDPFNMTKDSSDPFNAPKEKDDPFAAPKDEEDRFSSSNSDPFNTPKDDPFNTPKDDPFNTPKDDPFHNPKDDPFNSPKDDPFNTPKDDPFNTPKDDPFNTPKDDPFNSPKDDPFNTPKDDPFNTPKDDPFNNPKDDPFNSPKDDPFNTPKDDPFNTPKDELFTALAPTPPKEDPFAAPTSSKDDPFTAPKTPPKEDPVSAVTKPAQEDPFAAPTTPPKDDPFSAPSKLPEADPFTSPTCPKEDPFAAASEATQKDPFTAPTTPPTGSVDPFGAPLARSPQGSPEAWEAPASSPPATGTDPWEKSSSPMETKGGDPWGNGATAPSPTDRSDPFGDSSNPGIDPWGALASAPTSTDAWGSAAPPSDCSPSSDPFGDGASKASDPWGAASNAASNATGKRTEREEETYRKTAQFLGLAGASLVDLDDLFSSNSKQRPLINTFAAQTQGNGTFKSRDRPSGPVVSSGAVAGMSLHETSALPGTPFSFTHALSHAASSPTFRAPVPSGETPLIQFPFHTMGVSYSGFSLPQASQVETRVIQSISGGGSPQSVHNMKHVCGGVGMVQTGCPVGAGQLRGSTSQAVGGVPMQSRKL